MKKIIYDSLSLREIFHLELLRWIGRCLESKYYAVKGGVNLRIFFNSPRYSEDMDLDVFRVSSKDLKKKVMKILEASSFEDSLKPFGIKEIIPPNIVNAKQTETTQRFKVHLITNSQEDLFTKIEFSRRGFKGKIIVQPASDIILRAYKMPPILVPHYDIDAAIAQKINALANRAIIQARDIFDLYILSSQCDIKGIKIMSKDINTKRAHNNIFEVSFEQFRDTVVSYLDREDQNTYKTQEIWDEVRLKVSNLISELDE